MPLNIVLRKVKEEEINLRKAKVKLVAEIHKMGQFVDVEGVYCIK